MSGAIPTESGALEDSLHVFAYEDRDILYQVDTGLFFEIDGIAKDVIACAGVNARREHVIAELSDRYPLDHIVGVIEELEGRDVIAFSPGVPAVGAESVNRDSSVPEPVTVCLHVAHACNVACTYCFAHGGNYGGKAQLMDWTTARRAVDWLLDRSAGAGACRIVFFGGGPLLSFGLIRQVVSYALRQAESGGLKVEFGMTTNGTILTPEIEAFIDRHDIQVVMSLDGSKAAQDAHRRFHDGSETHTCASANARKLAGRRPDLVQIRATLTADNLDIPRTVRHLSDLGSGSISVAPVCVSPHHPDAIRREHLPELRSRIRELSRTELADTLESGRLTGGWFASRIRDVLDAPEKEHGCGGGRNYFGVAADGGIYFCSAFASMPEFRMGSVQHGIDPDISARFDRQFRVDGKTPCSTCWARHLCGGGCAYDAQVAGGSATSPNPVSCEQIRYGYELAMGMAIELSEQNPELFESLVTVDE